MAWTRGRSWSDDDEYEEVPDPARRLGPPAVGLIVVAMLGFGGNFTAFAVLKHMRRDLPPAAPPPNVDDAAFRRGEAAGRRAELSLFGVPTFAVYGLVMAGGVVMHRRQSRGLAITGAVAAMLPCGTAFPVGLPVGIWALVVLSNPEVARTFRRRRHRSDDW